MKALGEILELVLKYGLSTTLLFVMMWAYDRQQKKHAEDRKGWDKERDSLYARVLAESDERIGDSRTLNEQSLRMQEIQLSMVNRTGELVAQANQRERELRDEQKERERDLRGSNPGFGGRTPR